MTTDQADESFGRMLFGGVGILIDIGFFAALYKMVKKTLLVMTTSQRLPRDGINGFEYSAFTDHIDNECGIHGEIHGRKHQSFFHVIPPLHQRVLFFCLSMLKPKHENRRDADHNYAMPYFPAGSE